jgi:hypothetical protein
MPIASRSTQINCRTSFHAPGKGALAAGVLDRVRNLVRRNRDRGDRAAVVMLRQEPHRLALGIVMISFVGRFDFDIRELRFVEQMPGQFAAGTGQVRAIHTMLAQHVPDPPLRTEHQRDQQDSSESEQDGHNSPAFSRPPHPYEGDAEPSLVFSQRNTKPTRRTRSPVGSVAIVTIIMAPTTAPQPA